GLIVLALVLALKRWHTLTIKPASNRVLANAVGAFSINSAHDLHILGYLFVVLHLKFLFSVVQLNPFTDGLKPCRTMARRSQLQLARAFPLGNPIFALPIKPRLVLIAGPAHEYDRHDQVRH